MSTRSDEAGAHYPWYRARPRTALVLAAVLFVAVSLTRLLVNGAAEAVDILYSLPIALLAMTFGVRGGIAGAGVGFSLFAILEEVDGGGQIGAIGWVARATGMLLLGFLLGRATDQVEAGQRAVLEAHDHRRRLQETARRQAEALEISDSVLQHLAAAKWMVEAGRNDEAIELLSSTIEKGQRIVSQQLPLRPDTSEETVDVVIDVGLVRN